MLQESYDQSPYACAAHDDQRRLGGMRSRPCAGFRSERSDVTLGQDRSAGAGLPGPTGAHEKRRQRAGRRAHAEKLDGHAQRSEGGDRPPPGQEEQRRENQAHVRRQVGSHAHVETERNSPSSLELHRDALRSLERDLDGAPGQAAATEELERLACRSEGALPAADLRRPDSACGAADSPEREVLDRLFGRSRPPVGSSRGSRRGGTALGRRATATRRLREAGAVRQRSERRASWRRREP